MLRRHQTARQTHTPARKRSQTNLKSNAEADDGVSTRHCWARAIGLRDEEVWRGWQMLLPRRQRLPRLRAQAAGLQVLPLRTQNSSRRNAHVPACKRVPRHRKRPTARRGLFSRIVKFSMRNARRRPRPKTAILPELIRPFFPPAPSSATSACGSCERALCRRHVETGDLARLFLPLRKERQRLRRGRAQGRLCLLLSPCPAFGPLR